MLILKGTARLSFFIFYTFSHYPFKTNYRLEKYKWLQTLFLPNFQYVVESTIGFCIDTVIVGNYWMQRIFAVIICVVDLVPFILDPDPWFADTVLKNWIPILLRHAVLIFNKKLVWHFLPDLNFQWHLKLKKKIII